MADKSARIMLAAFGCGGPTFLTPEQVQHIAARPEEHDRQRALGLRAAGLQERDPGCRRKRLSENPASNSQWLTYVFEQLPNIDTNDPAAVDRLLPVSQNLSDHVRIPRNKRNEQASNQQPNVAATVNVHNI